jgi:hypothetical protein
MDRDALLKTCAASATMEWTAVSMLPSPGCAKLLDNATEPYRIKTVRNKGYLFAPHARIINTPHAEKARRADFTAVNATCGE